MVGRAASCCRKTSLHMCRGFHLPSVRNTTTTHSAEKIVCLRSPTPCTCHCATGVSRKGHGCQAVRVVLRPDGCGEGGERCASRRWSGLVEGHRRAAGDCHLSGGEQVRVSLPSDRVHSLCPVVSFALFWLSWHIVRLGRHGCLIVAYWFRLKIKV